MGPIQLMFKLLRLNEDFRGVCQILLRKVKVYSFEMLWNPQDQTVIQVGDISGIEFYASTAQATQVCKGK